MLGHCFIIPLASYSNYSKIYSKIMLIKKGTTFGTFRVMKQTTKSVLAGVM